MPFSVRKRRRSCHDPADGSVAFLPMPHSPEKAFRKRIPRMQEPGLPAVLGLLFSPFFHATLESGVNIILEETHLSDYIKNADIVITGEGCLDGQTVMGESACRRCKDCQRISKTCACIFRLRDRGCKKPVMQQELMPFFRLCGALFRLKMPCRPTMQNRI